MSNPFWTLVSGPAAVALYQWNASGSQLAVANATSPDLVTSSQQLLNDALIPVAVGYAGAYAVARFTGAVPLMAALAGGLVSYMYYRNISRADAVLGPEEAILLKDADAVIAKIENL